MLCFIGIIAAAAASRGLYGSGLAEVFPARAMSAVINGTTGGAMEGRSAGGQAGMQAATLVITLVLAVVGGIIAGVVLKWNFWREISEAEGYEDVVHWDMEESEEFDYGVEHGAVELQSGDVVKTYQVVAQNED